MWNQVLGRNNSRSLAKYASHLCDYNATLVEVFPNDHNVLKCRFVRIWISQCVKKLWLIMETACLVTLMKITDVSALNI